MEVKPRVSPGTIALAIDVGTSNTCGYYYDGMGSGPQPLSFFNGSHILPSYVEYKADCINPIVGEVAKKDFCRHNRYVVANSKRLIGRRFRDENTQKFLTPCGVHVEECHGKPLYSIPELGVNVTPVDVVSEIIRAVSHVAEDLSGKRIDDLLITYPAHFDNNQRTATLNAAVKAGFDMKKVKMLNEPTAAAICYDLPSSEKRQHVLVYDLGGGTFDVSLIRIEKRIVTVLNTGGNNMLGGDDFTEVVAGIICQCYQELNGGKELLPPNTESYKKLYVKRYRQLLKIAEDTKISLKTQKEVPVDLSMINGGSTNVTVTESLMESVLRSRIQETIDLMNQVLKEVDMEKTAIDRVLLVGGSSKLNLVKRMLCTEFGEDKVSDTLDPDQCVSKGAVLYYKKFGTQIQDESLKTNQIGSGPKIFKGDTLREIVNISLGTRVSKEHRMDIMIPKGTIVPKTFSKTYCVTDYQTAVHDALFQGEAEFTKDCEEIAPIIINGITPAPEGQIKLEYTFTVDYGGVVTLLVKELPTRRTLFGPKRIEYEKKGN